MNNLDSVVQDLVSADEELALAMPAPNPFICTRFAIQEGVDADHLPDLV